MTLFLLFFHIMAHGAQRQMFTPSIAALSHSARDRRAYVPHTPVSSPMARENEDYAEGRKRRR